MKVFVTLATALGVSSAAPSLMGNIGRHNGYNKMTGRHMSNDMDMSERHMSNNMDMSGRHMADRQMSRMDMSGRQYSGMDQIHQDRQDMHRMGGMRNMADRQMSERQMSRMDMDGHSMSRHFSGVNVADRQMYAGMRMDNQVNQDQYPQYYKQDDFGNYAYGYSNGVSEKYEVGNPQSGVKGHYMYVDSNGVSQKVQYVADDQGFRIVGKEDQPRQHNRFTRSIEPDMIRMTSSYLMDSPALMDDDMLQMQRAMYRNGMSSNNNRRMFDNVMSGNRQMSGRQMSNRQMYDRQMSGRQMYDRQMSGRQMVDRQMSNGHMADGHLFDREMSRDNMMYRHVNGGRQMSDRRMFDREMSANNLMNGNHVFGMYNMDNAFDKMNMDNMRIGDGVLGEQSSLSQRMEIERIPTDNTMMSSYNRMF